MSQNKDFSGTWRCRYWYPSNQRPGTEDVSEYFGGLHKRGEEIVYESQPNDEKSYMFIRMTLDGDLLTGTWHEHTSPTGEFKGAQYSGAFQILRNTKNTEMDGKWVGIGQDNGKRQIYTGRLQLEQIEK